jgi:signal peptidase II
MASVLDNFRSPAALARFFITTIAGVSLDLWTKKFAFQKLAIDVVPLPDGKVTVYSRPAYQFIRGWLEFEVMPNQGAVFGIGQGMRVLFIIVSIAAIIFLTYLFATSGKRRFYQVVLGMLLAGVLGNMYDRITLGYVRDMIHALPRWPHFFPWIFNVADSLLCVGVGLMILFSVAPGQKKTGQNDRQKDLSSNQSA